MENLHYEDRIKRLGLMRLDRRTVRNDLIEIFKKYIRPLNTFLNLMKLEEEDIAKSCLKEGRRLCWIIRNTNRIVDKWTGLPNSRMECITLHRAMLRSANYTENSLSPERQESATVHAASVLPHHLSRTIYHDISETMTLVVKNWLAI